MIAQSNTHGWGSCALPSGTFPACRKPSFLIAYTLPEDLIAPSRLKRNRSKNQGITKLHEDLERIGLLRRRQHDLRRTFISLARTDGTRKDVLEFISHGRPAGVMDLYTELPWGAAVRGGVAAAGATAGGEGAGVPEPGEPGAGCRVETSGQGSQQGSCRLYDMPRRMIMESKLAQSSPLARLFGIQHPIVLAPLAGGPSTPELVAAVSQAGGLGSLGAAYLDPAAIRQAIATIRRLTDRPFAVNLFLPEPSLPGDLRVKEVQALLASYRAELGLPEPPLPAAWSIPFEEQLDAVVDAKVPVCSFVFGVPAPDVVRRLHQSGARVIGTATHVEEAQQLATTGVDAIVAQGGEAGGHRGTFLGRAEDALIGTMALVPQVVDAVPVPVIAAGGIMDGRGILAALALGACAAQLGTAFLLCDEAGTDEAYRAELVRSRETDTTLTRAFSGRAARGLRNRFADEWAAREPAPFPVQNVLTRDVRNAARKQGRSEFLSLWAGQGAPRVRRLPAGELVHRLVEELRAARDAVAAAV